MAKEVLNETINELQKVVLGHDEPLELILTAIICGGHLLLEGAPGVGKTLLARSIAKVMDLNCSRIQFTPDLMPADIVGISIYDSKTADFQFRPGPIFTDIVLADELNRAPARTQAALLEAMQERQVTIDGKSHQLSNFFTVVATQNPFEYAGTYALPEAQLDRFLMKIKLNYPPKETLKALLKNGAGSEEKLLLKVLSKEYLETIRREALQVKAEPPLIDYITDIILETHSLDELASGASPRASLMLLNTSKCRALMNGRSFIIPEDVQQMAVHVLAHRLRLTPEARIDGFTAEKCIEKILKKIEVPR